MRRTLQRLLGGGAVIVLCACGAEPRVASAAPAQQSLADENARLRRELDEAQHKLDLQGEYTADATKTLNELQDHLAKISTLEGEVRGGSSTEDGRPLSKSRRERMLAAVQQMEQEVQLQAKLISDFRAREQQYAEKVAELGAAIGRFEQMIATKNREIVRLRGELEIVTVEVQALRADQKANQQELARKQEALDAAHTQVKDLQDEIRSAGYIIAPIGHLIRLRMVVQKRVLLTKVWKVAPTLDPEKLERVDVDEMRALSIVAPRNRIEIISPHPPDSYTLLPESANQCLLTITDPKRFWTTKYLVVGIR